MAFLTPLFLFALAAVSIPVAIHLIRRDKPPTIAFSSLRFFQSASRKQFLFQKFQQWLLLLLRALVIALAVLAFARPFFGQTLSAWTNMAPRSVAVLVDTSMSMAYGDYLDRAKKRAREILQELGPGDEATLITFSDKTQAVHGPTTDIASLQAVLETALVPGFDATRYFPALRLADELLQESAINDTYVHLISDFQASGMRGFDNSWRLSPGVDFVPENLAERGRRNLTVTGLRLPQLHGDQLSGDLFVRVRSNGSLRESETEMQVTLNGEEQFRQIVDLGEQSEMVVKVPLDIQRQGIYQGAVTLEDKHFTPDNTFYFTLDVPGKIPVLVVNGGSSTRWYEDEAHWFSLAVSGHEQSPFSVNAVEQQAFDPDALERYQIVVLLNLAPLTELQTEALEQFVSNGGSLLLAPAGRARADVFNRQLGRLSPATLVQRGQLERGDYLLISDIKDNHPVLRPLGRDWMARFTDFWSLKAHESAEVLMRFDNGAPALVERRLGEGRSMIFASSLDLEWNNLPLQGMYLPFIHETLKYLANSVEKKSFYQVSDVIPLSSKESKARLVGPNEQAQALPEGAESFTLRVPGIYRYETADEAQFYAANIPLDEADFAVVSPTLIYDQILHPETTPSPSPAARAQLVKTELEKPQRLWWWLLLAVAALLVTESVVANRTYR